MASTFLKIPTKIKDLFILERSRFCDQRGWFERLFCAEELLAAGFKKTVLQINRSLTRKKGSIRGMHFQWPPDAEIKIVTCLKGSIFDVAVDLRSGSETFLKWHSEELTEENHRSLIIPEGFAHGFQTMTNDCELLYIHTAAYNPLSEGALNPLDEMVGIQWPIAVSNMSERDMNHPMIDSSFKGLVI